MKQFSQFLFLLIFLVGCATSPTGRKQLLVLSEGQMNKMGVQSFDQLKKQMKISSNPKANKLTKCLSHDLLKAAGQNPAQWEVVVFEEKSPNAFALPGNKIGVHTGMINLAKNADQLAAVIGHEIGHVLADHGNERASQNLVTQGGLMATSLVLGPDNRNGQIVLAAVGLGAQYGILMPYSRKHETEADKLGVQYMSAAGYDPREASALWVLMGGAGSSPPEFLSTHPSPSSRVKYLATYAQGYMDTFQANKNSTRCHSF